MENLNSRCYNENNHYSRHSIPLLTVAMRKINILYCVEYLAYGGTEKQLWYLIEALDKSKFQPFLCCLRNSIIGENRKKEALDLFQKINCTKIQLDFISFRELQSWIELVKLIQFIKKYKIDIVQTYFQDPAVLGVLAAKLSGAKYVIACFRDMAFWRDQENDWKLKMAYKFCSAYIANSSAVRALYEHLYNLSHDKFTVIYNGIGIESFSPKAQKKDEASKDIIVGIVATLNREVKRVDIFLKAAAHVLHQIEGIKFVVAGDGELRLDLIKLSGELGINRNVEFLGRVENVPQLLSTIDIGVISSDSEGFSNAILEYMAAGVPVVATDVGGNSEIITNGINGLLVPCGDYHSLGEAIIQLITQKQVYDTFQVNALKTVLQDYTLTKCIAMYENYYRTLLSNQ